MIKIDNVEIVGWESAIRGMRNPMNSWDKSDTEQAVEFQLDVEDKPILSSAKIITNIGDNDANLMRRLSTAGSDHGKFLRMITVYLDITAPLYWWKEFDTYKVGTVANSCSTMHKIAAKEFTLEDFSWDHLLNTGLDLFEEERDGGLFKTNIQPLGFMTDYMIPALNKCREKYIKTKDKTYWWQMIQLLPSSYNQKRTIQLNYQVLKNMYHARKNHKLDEWIAFCNWIESLPFSDLITIPYKSDNS